MPRLTKTEVCELIRSWHTCEHLKGSLRFTTMVQAPSGSLITIKIRALGDRWVVSDGGAAFGEALSAGIEKPAVNLNIRRVLRAAGLTFNEGLIESPPIELGMLQQACAAVANTSRDIAEALITIGRDERELSLDHRTRRLLVDKFHTWVSSKPFHIRGQSEKEHKFDMALLLPNGRKVLIDTVRRHSNAINSVVVANIDIKNLHDESIVQRIVFDPSEPWKPEELTLLKVGAVPVALPQLPMSIEKAAA